MSTVNLDSVRKSFALAIDDEMDLALRIEVDVLRTVPPGMAEAEIRRYADEAMSRWPLQGLTVIHRFGRITPGQNIVLVVTASQHRQAAFEAAVNRAVEGRVRVRQPYLGSHKVEVMRRGRDLPLELTFSCIRPVGGRHCGACNKCAERKRAFADAGLADRTAYVDEAGG